MKIETQIHCTLYVTLADFALLNAGYKELFPSSDLAWFKRQVLERDLKPYMVLEWLDAVRANPGFKDNLAVRALQLKSDLLQQVPLDAVVVIKIEEQA